MQAGYRYAVITRYMSGSIHFRTHFVVYRGDGGMQSRTELVPRHDHPYGRSLRRWGTSTTIVAAGATICARAGADVLHLDKPLPSLYTPNRNGCVSTPCI